MAGPVMDTIRGSDRKKHTQWNSIERVFELDNGYYIGRIHDKQDCSVLGKLMGHCAGGHWAWVSKNLTFFFSVFDGDDVPHSTIHAKQTQYLYRPMHNENEILSQLDYNGYDYGHTRLNAYDGSTIRRFGIQDSVAGRVAQIQLWQAEAQNQLRRYEARKEATMPLMKQYPLNRDNPYKYEMDSLNRKINEYKVYIAQLQKQIDEIKENGIPLSLPGHRVLFQNFDICFISSQVKGGGDAESYSRMTDQWVKSLPCMDGKPIRHPMTGRFHRFESLQEFRDVAEQAYVKVEV